jgi:hypothetical protein
MAFSVITKVSLLENYAQAAFNEDTDIPKERHHITPEEIGVELTRKLIEARLSGKDYAVWMPSSGVDEGLFVGILESLKNENPTVGPVYGYDVDDQRSNIDPTKPTGIVIKFPIDVTTQASVGA